MKVGVLSPTTWQLVEKMAALFPDGVDVVGPLADDGHYWNDYRRKTTEWEELGLKVRLRLVSYAEIDFSEYDLVIESAETFGYSKEWQQHCTRLECPVVLKACWTGDPRAALPAAYIEKMKRFPVLLEMPAHADAWRAAGFTDVNVIFNPVGEWWFEPEWTGADERILFVLSGTKKWRGDPAWHGLEIWDEICRAFPGRAYHHDGSDSYRTSREMTLLYAGCRAFVNLDRPYGQGERPMTLAFTEALSAGLPVAARKLEGLSYQSFIDGNGVCTNDVPEMLAFLDRCLTDREFARACGERSRRIARDNFSVEALRPRYDAIIARARDAFDHPPAPKPGGFRRLLSLFRA